MGLRDRLAGNAARNQEAMPVSSVVGVFSSVVGAIAFLVLAVVLFANGSPWGGVLFLVVWAMAVGNLWLRHVGRRQRTGS